MNFPYLAKNKPWRRPRAVSIVLSEECGESLQLLAKGETSWIQKLCFARSNQLTTIKKLRDQSGAPLGDVKKALEEANYDFDQAYDALRLKGLAAAAKKATRVATDGLIGVAATAQHAAMIEVNCETDFVARNESFCQFVGEAASTILQTLPPHSNGELKAEDYLQTSLESTGRTIEKTAAELSGNIREKINIRRVYSLRTSGRVFAYSHNPPPLDIPGLGKIGSIVSLEGKENTALPDPVWKVLSESGVGAKLAMHIAGINPRYLNNEQVDQADLDHEMSLLRQQALKSGKPEKIIERIVKGRMEKFYDEFCLMQQSFLFEENKTVAQYLSSVSKQYNLPDGIIIGGFVRWQCGEGIEQEISGEH